MSRLILNLHTLPENKINTGRHRESHTRGDSAAAHVIHMETTRRSNTITSRNGHPDFESQASNMLDQYTPDMNR